MIVLAVIAFIALVISSLKFFTGFNAYPTAYANRLLEGKISELKRKQIDDFKLSRFTGIWTIVMAVLWLVSGFGIHFGLFWLNMAPLIVMLCLLLFYQIYIKIFVIKGTHFRKK